MVGDNKYRINVSRPQGSRRMLVVRIPGHQNPIFRPVFSAHASFKSETGLVLVARWAGANGKTPPAASSKSYGPARNAE